MAVKNEYEYDLGVGKFTFGSTEIGETYEDNDTKLSITNETKGVRLDQVAGEKNKRIIKSDCILTCSVPYNETILTEVGVGFESGSTTGFAYKDPIGLKLKKEELKFLPKGTTTGSAEELVFPVAEAKLDLESNFKKDGQVFCNIEFTCTAGTDGIVMKTGDFA